MILHLMLGVGPPEFRSVRSAISTGTLVQLSDALVDTSLSIISRLKTQTETIRQGTESPLKRDFCGVWRADRPCSSLQQLIFIILLTVFRTTA